MVVGDEPETTFERRPRLRQPRVAELIADELRARILRGDHREGEMLPKQDDLLAEFAVSRASLREALRILETEGLVRVRRGSRGGATVRFPQPRDAAYMLALELRSRAVPLADVGAALQHLEPACAALCADPAQRDEALATLRPVHEASVRAVDDDLEFVVQMRRFHEATVGLCGCATMVTVVGSLVELWSAKEHAWARVAADTARYPPSELRDAGLRAHGRIIELIERGDADGVARVAAAHLGASQMYALSDGADARVDAASLRGPRTG